MKLPATLEELERSHHDERRELEALLLANGVPPWAPDWPISALRRRAVAHGLIAPPAPVAA